jgi:hypothetical protein
MLTKIKINIAHGVLARFGVDQQAYANIKAFNHGNLAYSSVWQNLKFFHVKYLILNEKSVNQSFP